MSKFKLLSVLLFVFFIITGCSMVDKLKEKLSSKDDNGDKKEEKKKEETKEVTSGADLKFYNNYIDVSNKIQEAGDKVFKDYISEIPAPKSLSKNSFIVAVSFSLSVGNLERVMKEYNRSFYDGGELSKLTAAGEMKDEIETEMKNLLKVLDEYYNTASKVSDYYSKGEFKKDISKAAGYDEELRSVYEKYKSAFDKFTIAVKRHKPEKEKRDLNSITNPDEYSVTVLTIAYENTLDKAEDFYDNFTLIDYKGDLTETKSNLKEFEEVLKTEKNNVMSAEFSEKTKYMKYSYEDYFLKMANMFLDAAKKFVEDAPGAKNQNEFNRLYDDVVNNYNYMISAYNTNINVIDTYQIW